MKDFDGSVAMKKIEKSDKIRVFFHQGGGVGNSAARLLPTPINC